MKKTGFTTQKQDFSRNIMTVPHLQQNWSNHYSFSCHVLDCQEGRASCIHQNRLVEAKAYIFNPSSGSLCLRERWRDSWIKEHVDIYIYFQYSDMGWFTKLWCANKVYLKNSGSSQIPLDLPPRIHVFCGAFFKIFEAYDAPVVEVSNCLDDSCWTFGGPCPWKVSTSRVFEVGGFTPDSQVLRGEAKLQTSSLQTAAQHLLLPQLPGLESVWGSVDLAIDSPWKLNMWPWKRNSIYKAAISYWG